MQRTFRKKGATKRRRGEIRWSVCFNSDLSLSRLSPLWATGLCLLSTADCLQSYKQTQLWLTVLYYYCWALVAAVAVALTASKRKAVEGKAFRLQTSPQWEQWKRLQGFGLPAAADEDDGEEEKGEEEEGAGDDGLPVCAVALSVNLHFDLHVNCHLSPGHSLLTAGALSGGTRSHFATVCSIDPNPSSPRLSLSTRRTGGGVFAACLPKLPLDYANRRPSPSARG